MARCEVCGRDAPAGAAFCPSCGHRLGAAPQEPVLVEVRPSGSCWDGCVGCFGAVVVGVLVVALISWVFGC